MRRSCAMLGLCFAVLPRLHLLRPRLEAVRGLVDGQARRVARPAQDVRLYQCLRAARHQRFLPAPGAAQPRRSLRRRWRSSAASASCEVG